MFGNLIEYMEVFEQNNLQIFFQIYCYLVDPDSSSRNDGRDSGLRDPHTKQALL